MKKILIIALTALVSLSFCSCSDVEKSEQMTVERPELSKSADPEKLLPESEFGGVYKNNDYTVKAVQGDDGLFTFTVVSAKKNNRIYKWKMTGYFGAQTYRVSYTDARKINITYFKNGKEKSRETVYKNGAGRFEFKDANTLVWENSMEPIDGSNEFVRK